ncbi:phosphoribosylglycinamide formyltransferase [Angelakisella massiliensis]|uniref:phosphoribosylglycinamide formyltransferase n=1 Tax=Angelakisella massiliensis TaxID=1871018 RepID=UPI0008F915C7|nr:phosphoribosylglycinamide formyltransferase [Angelakisella massiliensis]
MINIAVFVSGGGTNLQALLDAQDAGMLPHGRISLVLSSRDGVYALERAKNHGVPTVVVSRKAYPSSQAFDQAILDELEKNNIQLIVLAGFLSILGPELVARYDHRIINVHPSLIPSFCGAGFYGLKVHQAALDYGVKVTGATVHYVNEIPDGGEIILQKAVDVLPGDTPEILQKRVMEQAEWKLLPAAAELVCRRLSGENA